MTTKRRPLAFTVLAVALLVVPLLEILAIIQVGRVIGEGAERRFLAFGRQALPLGTGRVGEAEPIRQPRQQRVVLPQWAARPVPARIVRMQKHVGESRLGRSRRPCG